MNTQPESFPLHLKKHLIDLARRLPEGGRGSFVRNATERLMDLVGDHPRTVVYAGLGWAIGTLLDQTLSFGLPFTDTVVQLTGDKASSLGTATGAVLGFIDDRQEQQLRRRVSRVIQEEFARAKALRSEIDI